MNVLVYETIGSMLKILFTYTLMKSFGFIKGAIFMFILVKFYKFLLQKLFKFDLLSSTDKVMIGRENNERYNLLVLMKLNNFNVDVIRNLLIDRAIKKVKKLRQKLQFLLFDYYWTDVTVDEAIKRIIIHNKVNGEKEINDFLSKQINNHLNIFNEMPYLLHLFPAVDDKGYIVLQFDHTFSDGLGILSLICSIADNYSLDMFPSIMKRNYSDPISYLKSIIFFPYYALKMLFLNMIINPKPTPYKLKSKSTGFCDLSISKNYSYIELSKINKKWQVSFNDLVLSVFSCAMKKLSKDRKDLKFNDLERFIYTIPIGSKNLPQRVEDVSIKNEINGMMVDIDAIDDVHKDINKIHNQMRQTIKNAAANRTLVWLADLLSEFVPIKFIQAIIDHHILYNDAVLSNTAGCTKELFYSNAHLYDGIPICGTGRVGCFITVSTFNNILKIALCLDKAVKGISANEIMSYVENELDNLIKKNN